MDTDWLNLAAALGIGLLIGIERERRKGEGPLRRAAGIRTFAVASLLGAVSQMLGGTVLLAAAALGTALLTAIAYWRRHDEDPGLTTEVALLLTLLLGNLAMVIPGLAAGLGVLLAVLLFARAWLHHFARTLLTEQELNDALVLAASALVVLPLIPDHYIGPFDAINPRTIWTIVVLMMSIGAAGHIALRLLGPRFGLPVAGFASGFVSSIATIGAMGERALRAPDLLRPAVAGAVLSTLSTIVQLVVVLAFTSMEVLRVLTLPLAGAGAMAFACGLYYTRAGLSARAAFADYSGAAFSVRTALILLVAAAVESWFGHRGVIVAAALSGFADTHSTAVSVASLTAGGKLPALEAVVPILAGLTANTVSKAVVAWTVGRDYAVRIIPGLVLTIAAAWAGAAWVLLR